MIRRILKRVARRLVPRVPGEAPSGRTPPTSRAEWRPAPAPAPPASPTREDDEDEAPEVEVDATTVAAWLAEGVDLLLVDVREPYEVAHGHAEGALLLPMNRVPASLSQIPADRRLVVHCAHGMRSHGVTSWLREQGYDDAWSLAGSVHELVDLGAVRLVRPGQG